MTRRRRNKWTWKLLGFALVMVGVAGSQPGFAQNFDSGSDGSDGALTLTDPGEVIFDPTTLTPPLDPDGDNVYHFTTITIGAGVTVRLTASKLGSRGVFWLASGPVQIDGTIDLSGTTGHAVNEPLLAKRRPAEPGAGGFPGGVGEFMSSPAQAGSGPGAGGAGRNVFDGHGGSGAGYRTGGGGSTPGSSYGNTFLVPLLGGSGGGGGSIQTGSMGGGGGAGGGALLIASSVSITVDGAILVKGGFGGSGSFDDRSQGGGGGGSGGAIHLLAQTVNGTGALDASGGDGGGGRGGGGGSTGRIRVDAFEHNFNGSANSATTFGSPFVVLPADDPMVWIVSVAGVPVPANPMGTFEMPDVTIMEGASALLEIEAENVPLGTVVKVHFYSENGADQVVDSTPLAGTLELSTATATITIPPGFSRSFARVTFEP